MTFGMTVDDLPCVLAPEKRSFEFGSLIRAAHLPGFYVMECFELEGSIPLHFYKERAGCYFVEEGEITICALDRSGNPHVSHLSRGQRFSFSPCEVHALKGKGVVYLFSNDAIFQDAYFVATKVSSMEGMEVDSVTTFDRREKYWGKIESIIAGDVAAKRIEMMKGGQSSLEFHCHKTESYFIHSGRLKVGLRFGRAENSAVVLGSGQSLTIRPGCMHMRIALEETVLMEISTRDSDRDSYLVEDGRTYEHSAI